ncbi:MAG: helix-turn-helix domain-containing protein [Lachnospiraceae bacterium]|nr:helix-turn-helix domain-containing protein [Lachnospiraceae bacterium]
MDQAKIGLYLKELRKSKNLTQEELSEKLGVSRRSVSRWETGNNLPDLDLLIELADFYDVDLRDMLTGNTEDASMDKELKETALMVAEYSNEEKMKVTRRFNIMFLVSIIAFAGYLVSIFFDLGESPLVSFLQGITLGIAFGMLVVGFIITSRNAEKIRQAKLRILNNLKKGSL